MLLFQNLKLAIELLKPWQGYYAVCGGIAACLYRELSRYTSDIDIAIIDSPKESAREIADFVLQKLGYEPKVGYVTDQHGRLIEKAALIIGRDPNQEKYVGVDILLPVMPWIQEAVQRAQLNKLNYGFAEVATIIPEDLIVAKLYAYQGTPDRKYDLDDILSIYSHTKEINNSLLDELIQKHMLKLPQQLVDLMDTKK